MLENIFLQPFTKACDRHDGQSMSVRHLQIAVWLKWVTPVVYIKYSPGSIKGMLPNDGTYKRKTFPIKSMFCDINSNHGDFGVQRPNVCHQMSRTVYVIIEINLAAIKLPAKKSSH